MSIDIERFRKISSFANMENDFERESILQQSIEEFDFYLKYSPNRQVIYVNNDNTPIMAVFQDVSDLEIRTDSKWMLTSLKDKIYLGDIFDLNGRKWMCIYDKEKNTSNCNKVKVQPCNYSIKIPYLENGVPKISNVDSMIMTYLTDMKEFKQPFPSESGTTFITVQFNPITDNIKREDRIWLYESAFKVTGIDFTNIDFYRHKGFLKWTLRPDKYINDLDNIELGVCDYYKFFNKDINTDNSSSSMTYSINISNDVHCANNYIVNVNGISSSDKVDFTFVGDNLNCILKGRDNNSCVLVTGGSIGFITIKAIVNNDNTKYCEKRIIIQN